MSEYIELIERNSKAIEKLAQSYAQLRALGVESYAIAQLPDAVCKLATQIAVQCDAEVAVRKP